MRHASCLLYLLVVIACCELCSACRLLILACCARFDNENYSCFMKGVNATGHHRHLDSFIVCVESMH